MGKCEPVPAAGTRFLVLGCGSIGRRHIGNLRALGAKEILAFDISPARRRAVADEFHVQSLQNLETAWSSNCDVVLITVPTSLHLTFAVAAAERGCDLFIEKPLSNSWNGVAELLKTVQQENLITLVGCNMRFHPGLKTVKQLLCENAVGTVIAARVQVGHYLPDWHPAEDYRGSYSARADMGGGVILDAIHEIDYVRWLVGEVASAVCIAGKFSRLEIDTEDLAAILLRFEQGAVGEVHLDYIQRAYSRSCHIIGEEGTIYWDYTAGEVRWYSAHGQRWRTFSDPAGWEPNLMYLDEMRHFFRCLSRLETPALDVFEAARVLQIALAAKEAARQQRWIEFGSPPWNREATS